MTFFDDPLPMSKPAPFLQTASVRSFEPDTSQVVDEPMIFPPGLVGDVTRFILNAAPYPAYKIALAAALGFLSGICGRSFNVSGAGLNQYILVLAETGSGKEIMSGATSILFKSISKSTPAAFYFKGPGELVSAPGLVKCLSKTPSIVCIIGEFGLKLREISDSRSGTIGLALKRALLQLFSKSGQGEYYDAMAYSDTDKNVAAIASPALTILCEGVPSSFYSILNENMIASGLLPRFTIFEHKGKRPYENTFRNVAPDPALIERLASLCAHSLSLSSNNTVHDVEMSPDAVDVFESFGRVCTDKINDSNSDTDNQLWNRAHIKAMKLAAICAVGEYYINPIICVDAARWAIETITDQTTALLRKFRHGEIGDVAGNQQTQLAALKRIIHEYATTPRNQEAKYHGTVEMRHEYVFTKSYVLQRLSGTVAFKDDKIGASASITRAIQTLIEGDAIQEIPKRQMLERYNQKPQAYVITDPAQFKVAEL